jgi:hypothetical protein
VQPVVFLAFVCLLFAPARAEPPVPGYASELVARADALRLYDDPAWLNLLHYRDGFFGRRSLVDDPRFFNAPDGKRNPRGELAATLQAFFSPPSTNELEHPVCRFVARYTWLKERLEIDPSRLPVPVCDRFEKVRDYLQATEVTLVFPAAYMNGPASMFGHTLLVFDAAEKNRLLSRAVSYAARTDTLIGPLFAFAGIAGLYPGYYAIQPYYEKVEQYGDLGHRDVWEYRLAFTPDEVDRMIRHAWELQNIWSRYYFFDENCAYNLYFFLDVARPSLKLADNDPPFIIPIDTVKSVDRAGLISSVEYRPCTVTRIKHMARLVDAPKRRFALDIAAGRRPPSDVLASLTNREDQVVVLDLASEYTQYLYTEELLPRENYSPRFIETLKVRSKLGKTPEAYADVPPPARPDEGHGPQKLSLGVGAQNDDAFLSLKGRIAYHALVDNHIGYDKGAEIQFLHTEARYYPERDAFELQHLDAVKVESIAPRDAFFRPGSWKVVAGLTQFDRAEHEDELVGQVRTGAGLAWEPRRKDLAWLWIEGVAMVGGVFDDDYAVGAGPAAGLMWNANPAWKHVLQARANYVALGDAFWLTGASWVQDVRLSQNRSVSLDLTHERIDNQDINEAHVRANFYF